MASDAGIVESLQRDTDLASFIGLGDFAQNLSVVLFKNRERSFKQLKSSDLSWKCT
jgi:hypothetical protein